MIWRHTTSDPVIANGRWSFLDARTLIAIDGPAPARSGQGSHIAVWVPTDVLERNTVSPGQHTAQVLDLPDLQASMACHYTVSAPLPVHETEAHDISPPSPYPELEDAADPTLERMPQGNIVPGTGECTKLLKTAGVSSMPKLPGLREARNHIGRSGWPGCAFEDTSRDGHLVLSNCRQGVMTEKRGFGTKNEAEEWLKWQPMMSCSPFHSTQKRCTPQL